MAAAAEPKISALESGDGCKATFVIADEDHTLGNALRRALLLRKEVVFAGYSIPHPLEPRIHLTVHTKGITARQALMLGIGDLCETFAYAQDGFRRALDDYTTT